MKILQRGSLDLILQDPAELSAIGLARATRFDLDVTAVLPWTKSFFGCWMGYSSPIIGSLTEPFIKEYAYLMMQRRSREGPLA